MKNFRVIAIAMALVLSLAVAVFAVSRFATKSVVNATTSCCNDASCCADGVCKMNGSCCANHAACPLKKQTAEKAGFANVLIEDATTQSCDYNGASAATKIKNCCDNGGSACCGGGSCCKSKTTVSL